MTGQNNYVESMEDTFIDTKEVLKQETANINQARKMSQGLCWMYGVIVAELVLLIVLLYVGLS